MPKKPELMLAVWPNALANPYSSPDLTESQSIWLSFRSIEEDEDGERHFNHAGDGIVYGDLGLYVWAWTEMSVCVELCAHEVHKASSRQLQTLAAYLKKQETKITKAGIPKSFGIREHVILTLQAIGVKKAVMIGGFKERLEIVTIEEALALPTYAKELAMMQALRERGRKEAA